MTDESREKLSPLGESRREAMLSELTAAMRRTHHARRLRRRSVGAAVCALAALAVARLSLISNPTPGRPPIEADRQGSAPSGLASAERSRKAPPCVVEHVRTDPAILDRFAARPTNMPTFLDDRTLITALARIDRPVGLIRSGNHVRLTAPVTDAELELRQ